MVTPANRIPAFSELLKLPICRLVAVELNSVDEFGAFHESESTVIFFENAVTA
jgi:hypothetical protein